MNNITAISDDTLKEIFDKFYEKIMSNSYLAAYFKDKHQVKAVIAKQMKHFRDMQTLSPQQLKTLHKKLGRQHAEMGLDFSAIMTAGDYLFSLFLKHFGKNANAVTFLDNLFTKMRNDFAYGYFQYSIEEFIETLRVMNVISLETRVIKEFIEWFMMLNSALMTNDEESLAMLEEAKPSLGSVIIENKDHLKKLDKLSSNFDQLQNSMLFGISMNDYRSALASYTGLKETFLALMYIVSISERTELAKSFATDPLTKALTRKEMKKSMDKAAAQAMINKKAFSISITDIDHFKKVNDTYGHKAGDIVLKDFAAILMKHTKDREACVIRYGGEEFVIIFPNHDATEAAKILEDVRLIIEMTPFNIGNQMIHITSSFGLHQHLPSTAKMPDPLDLVKLADEKLYQAKASGRNRIIF